jgi:RNA polymerase sigma factor (sigma-70 family)
VEHISDDRVPEQRDFAEVWHEIEPAVRRSLSTAPADVVEDVLQETGIKLMKAWDSIDHTRPTFPLAVTIARNTLRDELRKISRHTYLELSEEHRVADDLDARVSARIELARVEAELPRLTPGQRSALLMEVGGGSRSADSPKIKMLRARARRRLRELVAQAGGFVAAGTARLRSAGFQRAGGVVPDLGILVQALLLALVATSVTGPGVDRRPDRQPGAVAGAAAAEQDASGSTAPPGAPGDFRAAARAAVAGTPAGTSLARPETPGGGTQRPGEVLPGVPVPRSKGEAHDEGYLGTEGYTIDNGGSTTTADHEVAWRYEGEWESPACVQNLAEGQAPGPCTVPEKPSARATVEVDGHQVTAGSGRD